ncbi:MAG: hypothetical protein ACI86X_000680 [Moritella sp.]|jgi:hypothetical protein
MENNDNLELDLDQIDVHSEADEAALLNSLNDEDFDPGVAEQNSANNSALLEQGAATVVTVLGMGEQLIKQFGHKDFAFDGSQVNNVANATAPLFVKYGGELPPWLAQYKEEIMFTFATGALCLTSFAQVKALNKMDAAKEVKDTQPEAEISQAEQVA